MKGVVQQKRNLYLVCPKIMLPPINRDTPQNMPVLNGGISAGYLYFSLKSEENGISRLSLKALGLFLSFERCLEIGQCFLAKLSNRLDPFSAYGIP